MKSIYLRITDGSAEYLVEVNQSKQIESIICFRTGSRVGTDLSLSQVPWSARWQIEQELEAITTL